MFSFRKFYSNNTAPSPIIFRLPQLRSRKAAMENWRKSFLLTALKNSPIINSRFIPVSIGFALGSLFVHLSDKLIPRFVLLNSFLYSQLCPLKFSCVVAELSLINAIQKCEGHQEHSRRPRRTGQKIRHGNTERSSDIGLPEISPSNQRYSSIDAERVLRFRHALKTSRMNDGNEETTLQYDDPLTPEIDDKEGCDGNREQNNSSKASSDREKAEIERIVSWKRILLLIMAVTVHNIPEGLAGEKV